MTYPEAQQIALDLAFSDCEAAKMLRILCDQTKRKATFIIMRYGDPRTWTKLPSRVDGRSSRVNRVMDRTVKVTRKVADQVDYVRSGTQITATRRTKDWRVTLKTRPCVLEHAMTGRVIEAPSIVVFCEQANLKHSKYHITPILDGHRVHHKGWYLPAFLDQILHLRDIYSNEYQITVREWIKSGRTGGSAQRLLTGEKRAESRHQIMLASTTNDSQVRPRPNKITQVEVTKNGQIYTGASIKEAGTKAGLKSYHNLYSVAYGFAEEAQGVRIKSIKVEKKRVL